MEWIAIALVLGFLPALIAKSKGHSFFAWYIYGALLFIVALIHAIVLKPVQAEVDRAALATGDSRKCPFCAEIVRREAKVCRFCSRDLPEAPPAAPKPETAWS